MPDLVFEAVVVTYNSADHIRACLTSLLKAGAHVIVVDNESRDGTLRIISEEFPEVLLIRSSENLGYSKALNVGISKTNSPFVLAANADTVFPKSSLQALAKFLEEHPQVGIVGAQEIFPDGSWQCSWGDIPDIYEAIKTLLGMTSLVHTTRRLLMPYVAAPKARPVGYVDGAVMMIRRKAFDQIGGFDEGFRHYCEEADFCLRLRKAAWEVIAIPDIRVVHIRGGSSTKLEGYSDKFLRALATARCQLVRKHYQTWHVWLYVRIYTMHARKMLLMYRILAIVGCMPYARYSSTMASTFEREARIWNELKRQAAVSLS